ncbi:MAG: amidohydrolase [Ruminococcaceae bacterium]|nr:amidohydrolase [Oscillospiraceae bacterium]
MRNDFEIWDAHCHVYPEKIAARAVAGTDAFYSTVAAGLGTIPDLIAAGTTCGVDKFVIQSVATTPKQVASINRFIAEAVAADPEKLIGLGTIHPLAEDIAADVRELKALGLHGIKIHPDIQSYRIDDPLFFPAYALCEELDLPILMHTGDSRYDYSNPNRLIPVLQKFPRLRVIGAHFGGWSIWEEAAEKLAGMPNLWVDCSSTVPFMKGENQKIRVEKLIRKYGVDRVLFGTDYPMWSHEQELDFFFTLDLTDEERRAILSENAKKVYG